MVYVAGKPVRLFSGLDKETGLHLLPIPLTPALLETYLPAQLGHADYPALVPDGARGHRRGRRGDGGLRVAARQRALRQGRAVRSRLQGEIPPVPAAAAPSEMAGRQPRRAGAGLDPIPCGAGPARRARPAQHLGGGPPGTAGIFLKRGKVRIAICRNPASGPPYLSPLFRYGDSSAIAAMCARIAGLSWSRNAATARRKLGLLM